MPSVSVILPVYNAEDTLDAAIRSIIGQSVTDFELIVIDDGSTDASSAILEEWAASDDRINPLFLEHAGIVKALNAGLGIAKGRYIARMDADDISLPGRLQTQKEFLDARDDVGLVSCLVEHLGDSREAAGYARHVRWINTLTSHDAIALNRFIESPLAHPSVMFRTSLLEKYGGYRAGDFPEDYELWLRWLDRGVRMEKVPELLLKWRDDPGRLSRSHSRYSFEAFYRIKARYLARWLETNNPNHPEVVIWGAGRVTRKRAEMLASHGVEITHYIDIDPNKIGKEIHGRPVWSPDDLPQPGEHFIIPYVGRHGANKMIREALEEKGYAEGRDFIFAA